MITQQIAVWLPYKATALADSLDGQFQWWLMGFLFGIVLCAVGQTVRFIRAAGGNHAP